MKNLTQYATPPDAVAEQFIDPSASAWETNAMERVDCMGFHIEQLLPDLITRSWSGQQSLRTGL